MIAPNNNLPATHFIEVWKYDDGTIGKSYQPIDIKLLFYPNAFTQNNGHTILYVFKIRLNQLPTKHKFK